MSVNKLENTWQFWERGDFSHCSFKIERDQNLGKTQTNHFMIRRDHHCQRKKFLLLWDLDVSSIPKVCFDCYQLLLKCEVARFWCTFGQQVANSIKHGLEEICNKIHSKCWLRKTNLKVTITGQIRNFWVNYSVIYRETFSCRLDV